MQDIINIVDLKATCIANGFYTALCPDVMAHATRRERQADVEHTASISTYHIYAQAYLPVLAPDFPNPVIDVLPYRYAVSTELKDDVDAALKHSDGNSNAEQAVNEVINARVIQITYTSKKEHKPPFSLWHFDICYTIAEGISVPFIKIDLRDTDPRTSRGTVTTVQDPEGGDR